MLQAPRSLARCPGVAFDQAAPGHSGRGGAGGGGNTSSRSRSASRTRSSPTRAERAARRGTASRGGRDSDPVRHHRPAGVDGPRPGDAPRASRPGYRVRYAIADVAAFVAPAARRRGGAAARRDPLCARRRTRPCYPPALSEGAASLLPDVVRPALVWTIGLDAPARHRACTCAGPCPQPRQAGLRGRAGRARRRLGRRAVGLRERSARPATARGRSRCVTLPMPEQEVAIARAGRLCFRAPSRSRVERPDLPAHRDGRGRDHARGRSGSCAPCLRRTRSGRAAASYRQALGSSGRGRGLPGVRRSLDPSSGTAGSWRWPRRCCAGPATRPSTVSCRRSPSMPPLRPRTRT